MRKFKQILTTIFVAFALTITPIVPANAAETTVDSKEQTVYTNIADLIYMPDGGLFDPFYYMNANLDVSKSLLNATGEITPLDLYNHYVTSGKAEGRFPYNIPENDKIFTIASKEVVDLYSNIPLNSNFTNKIFYEVGGGDYLTFTDDAGEFGKFAEGSIYCPQTYKAYYFHHTCVVSPMILRVYYSSDYKERLIFWGNNKVDLEKISDGFELGRHFNA